MRKKWQEEKIIHSNIQLDFGIDVDTLRNGETNSLEDGTGY
mgnify:CR=1 FL=1